VNGATGVVTGATGTPNLLSAQPTGAGFSSGNIVATSGFTNAANNGVFQVSATPTASTLTLTPFFGGQPAMVTEAQGPGRVITVTNAGAFAVGSSNTFTRSSGNFALGLAPGYAIVSAGFGNAANNGLFHITSVTSSTVTIAESSLVPEAEVTGRSITISNTDASYISPSLSNSGTISPDAQDSPWGVVLAHLGTASLE